MLYLVLLRYRASLSEVDRYLEAHRRFLLDHYQQGHFLLSGRQEPRHGGVILARAGSREEVARWIAEDPFHQSMVADYEIIAWTPTLKHPDVPEQLVPCDSAFDKE
jgi:uncharacterized protein YciI